MAATMQPTQPVPPPQGPVVVTSTDSNAESTNKPDSKGLLSSIPAWGSYIYQNFLFSPNIASEWLNLNSPFATSNATAAPDYFSQSWSHPEPTVKVEEGTGAGASGGAKEGEVQAAAAAATAAAAVAVAAQPMYQAVMPAVAGMSMGVMAAQQHLQQQQQQANSSAAFYHPQPSYYNASIATALIMGQQPPQPYNNTYYGGSSYASGSGSGTTSQQITPSVDNVEAQIVTSPAASDISSRQTSISASAQPHSHSTSRGSTKRRASSMDSLLEMDHEHEHSDHDQDHEIPEGVERDGMIWGLKVEDYRALSARERKRVRNRISARTFRAKRKEHLNSLESTINNKDSMLKSAQDEASRLRTEVADLRRRLAKYERVSTL